jgi:O-antigen ligase
VNALAVKAAEWRVYVLIGIVGFILLGPQNRLYRASDNWIYTGRCYSIAVGTIIVLLLVLWGLFAIKRGTAQATPHLYIDGLVIAVVLSCAVNSFTMASSVYLLALLVGVVVCDWISLLRLGPRQVSIVLYSVIGCAAIVATTNLIRRYFGWTWAFTEPLDWFHYESSERSSLWFGNPNDLGCVMAVAAVLSLWLLQEVRAKLAKAGAVALLCIFLKVLLDTYSRGAMTAMAIGGMVFLARSGWKTNMIVPVAGIVAVGVLSVGSLGLYSARVVSSTHLSEDRSISSRFVVWNESLEMMKRHPILGVGLGNYGREFAFQYHGRRRLPGFSTATNNVLTLGSESGVAAMFLYLAVVAGTVKAGLRASIGDWDMACSNGRVLSSILCVLIVCGFFTYNLCKLYFSMSWVTVGLMLCITASDGRVGRDVGRSRCGAVD